MKHLEKNGYTLVELLVAMAIVSIVMVAIISTYTVQVRAKNTQEALNDMTQAGRAALEIMTTEIRMAGLNPLFVPNTPPQLNPRVIRATQGDLIFSLDRGNGATNVPDGDCCDGNEVIRYHLSPAAADADNDGVNDNIAGGVECNLGRATGGGLDPNAPLGCGGAGALLPLARNVDALNFVYLDADGIPIAAATLANQAGRDTIRSVQVSIVARAGRDSGGFIYDFTNNDAYINLQGVEILPAQGDGFRRLLLATTINCRNLGF